MPIQVQSSPSRHILSDSPPLGDSITLLPLPSTPRRVGLAPVLVWPVLAGSATLVLAVIGLGILMGSLSSRKARAPTEGEPLASAPWKQPGEAKDVAPLPRQQERLGGEENAISPQKRAEPGRGSSLKAEEKASDPKKPSRSAEEARPRSPTGLVVKRFHSTSLTNFRKQIEDAPEVSLYKTLFLSDAIQMSTGGKDWRAVVRARADLRGLPQRENADCRLSSLDASNLQEDAVALRTHLSGANGATIGGEDLLARLRGDSRDGRWSKPRAVPVLRQMLMAEEESVRGVLIEQLSRIKGPAASVALAQRALFEFDASLRRKALEALRDRPVAEYRSVLLKGFRYPWAIVAGHAAEAVVALKLKETVPALRDFLEQPEPSEPFIKPGKGKYVREVVKINHLRNCLLCHDASTKVTDMVRGRVPITDEPVGGRSVYYGPKPSSIFVRADVTYLKQDFSVALTVKENGPWPFTQRFDFLVRERLVDSSCFKDPFGPSQPDSSRSAHLQALRFALRELTGRELALK
jgi:hypothetical protein